MIFNYSGVNINYEIKGTGKCLLFLHGWGGNISCFARLCDEFSEKFMTINLDFPPFGKSDDLMESWSIYDYADMVYNLLKSLEIKKATIIAHSFGGRVALILASDYNYIVDKMILIDSAGIKPKFNLKVKTKIIFYKFLNHLSEKYAKDMGSEDYKNLSPVMKHTFSKIVNQDLSDKAKSIICETLIVWGEKDKDTPLYMAKKLNKLIKDSALIILENCSHFAYIEKHITFSRIMNKFLGE